MDFEPFTGELDDDSYGLVPFNGKLDEDESHKFKSGEAFKATKELMPDLPKFWNTLKEQWNSGGSPMTPEIAQKMMQDEQAAGNAVLDIVGGIPGMLAGAAHGIYEGVKNLDAVKGLEAGQKTMHALMPSTLMGNAASQESQGYKTLMAPVTAVMDTLNAAPQGYGEILNAMGAPNAASQVNAAGQLGIMAGAGLASVRGMRESMRGEKAVTHPSDKLEALKESDLVPFKGELDEVASTAAHADDFAARNPYDVGGHVTKLEEGRPSTIDIPQQDLFGGEILNESLPGPRGVLADERVYGNEIPYTKMELGELPPQQGRLYGEEIPLVDSQLSLEPMQSNTVPTMNTSRTSSMSRAESQRLAQLEHPEGPIAQAYRDAMETKASKERTEAFKAVEEEAAAAKESHYQALEDLAVAQRRGEIDYQFAKDVVKDTSLMAEDATRNMRSAIEKSDLPTALESISKNHSNSLFRDLANYLRGKAQDLKVNFREEGVIRMGDRDATGFFDPNTGEITLSGLGASSPHTVMHETVHALTSQFIQARPNDIRVKGLERLYNKLDLRDYPAITNVREFVAEAFSDPHFQDYLKSQRYENRSVWTRFTDAVKNIFGVGQSRMGTALDHAIDLGKQVIEASDAPTRRSIMEQFKKAGVSDRLADLMAHNPESKPKAVKTLINEDVTHLKVPALEDAISDFKFYDKPIEEIKNMATASPDIPNTMMEKASHQLQAGALFESLKTRNPVVKYTYERITRATQEAARNIKEKLTNPETGLKAFMRELSPTEKGEIHSAMMLHEGVRELSAAELRQAGFSEKQINYYNQYRKLSSEFFQELNQTREQLGMKPMDERIAHVAGRFMGDFARMVYSDGKVVGRISGTTKWELNKASEYIRNQHPEWEFGPHEYNAINRSHRAGDRFGGLMEAINFISKTDADVKALVDSYKDYLKSDAVSYLNATRHAKAKVKEAGGVIGSEGNKPWKDTVKNAEEGMKAQLSYFEQGFEWMAMEKAVKDISTLTGDEAVVQSTPNAVKYSKDYVDHAMGRNQGKFSELSGAFLSTLGKELGVGHSNLMRLNNNVKHLVMQKFMGFLNVPFTITQLMQPLQSNPAMIRLLKSRGLEFSALDAQVKATETYLNAVLHEVDAGKLTDFERSAMKYADEMGVFDMKMVDHTKDINVSPFKEGFDKLADINITAPEHFTRGVTFLFYSHALKEAGVPIKDVFGAAENMTNFTMVNYHPNERPMGYAKLGWLGDVASTLSRYKHNQWSQLAFYAREGVQGKSASPLATMLATSLAFGGVMGFFAFQEADALYQLFTEKALKKPDSLTNQVLKSDLPEIITHGVFSSVGMDMTTRFSSANVIPDSIPQALMPYGSAVMDMANSTGRWALDPTSPTKAKQAVKAVAPQSVQGILENQMFTDKEGLYVNNTEGPSFGKGRVRRTENEQTLRNFGFRSLRESKELSQNYSNSQIEKAHGNIIDGLVSKAKYEAMDDSLTQARLQELIKQAAEHGEDPNSFVGKLTNWSMDRKLTQRQQMLLRNAQRGMKGAFNIREQR